MPRQPGRQNAVSDWEPLRSKAAPSGIIIRSPALRPEADSPLPAPVSLKRTGVRSQRRLGCPLRVVLDVAALPLVDPRARCPDRVGDGVCVELNRERVGERLAGEELHGEALGELALLVQLELDGQRELDLLE